ncbi:MAG: putrescine-ornithine antiporter [Psittacicella sp.]
MTTHKIGLFGLTVLIISTVMGSGIILLPSVLAGIGEISLLSWVVSTLGALALAFSFAKCAKYCKKHGGMSAYAQSAHGRSAFFLASYAFYVCNILAAVAIAVTCTSYFAYFIPWLGIKGHAVFGVIFLLVLAVVINFISPKFVTRVVSITVWGIISCVCIVAIIGWFWFKPHIFVQGWNPQHKSLFSGVASGISYTLWAFLGIGVAGAVSGNVKNPEKNLPRALIISIVFVAIAYILATAVIAGIIPNDILRHSRTPFGAVYSYMFTPFIGSLINLISFISATGSLFALHFANSMVAKVASDNQLFPKILGKTSKRGAAYSSLILLLVVELALALAIVSPDLLRDFRVLVNAATFLNLIPYILTVTALASLMARRKVKGNERMFGLIISIFATVYSIFAIYSTGQASVFYGCLILMFGYLFFGYIAARDIKNDYLNKIEVEEY